MGVLESTLSPAEISAVRRPLEKASGLPAACYSSPDIYQREVGRLFEAGWLCVGRVDQVPESGSYFTLDLVGRKLVVVREDTDRVRVLSRICRHRFAELVQGTGTTRSFQCPYHAWTYRLDGSLVGAPMMEEMDFDRSAFGLPEYRSEVWEGWIFVNFDGAAESLKTQLAPLAELVSRYRIGDMVATETGVYDSPFNWKILVDNFMESYHHIATHRDTLEPILPAAKSDVLDNRGPYSVLRMPSVVEGAAGPLPGIEGLEGWQANALVAIVAYPFHLFAVSPESMSWYHILPTEVGRFELRIYTCFPRETVERADLEEAREGLRAITRTVHEQDIGACEAVWSGLGSEAAPAGRLHRLEKAIWQQNQWWLERMAGDSV